MSAPVRLGPLLLSHPIGSGGMGAVWEARHPEGVPVAVKLLQERFAHDSRLLDIFRFEVRSVASLDHPAIVRVYDYGVVPESAAVASNGQIASGAPWFAMELAGRGTVADHGPVQSWSELSAIVLHLLEGLAHSHARGIVHRDLKPQNVLVRDDGLPTLTDFGIAHALTRGSPSSAAAGTPGYMAPEQVLGRIHDMGPWTDLYSLGSLVYTLLAGHPPFMGVTREEVFRKQLADDVQPLKALFSPPDGVRDWIARMLHRKPEGRFRCAADAAHAFATLDATPDLPPPLPVDWRPAHGPTTERPKGMGIAVFLLRPWPMVGRGIEQDQLWQALAEVRRDGAARAIVLRGEAGIGCTRLARWLAERAQESGAAEVVWVHHRGRNPGLRLALAQHLRVSDLDRDDAAMRLRSWLQSLGHSTADADSLPFATALQETPERAADEFVPLLGALTSERPLLYVVDDLHRADRALAVARALLDSDAPVLVVGTVNPALVEPEQQFRIDELCGRASIVEVARLPDGLQRELVDKGAGLAPRLAAELVRRTQGNPLFAVEAVRDWARRGLLVPTSTGFDLREAAAPAVPRSIREALQARLEPVRERFSAAGRSLELLATLGGERIRETDWLAAAPEAGIAMPPELLGALEEAGLVEVSARPGRPRRWTFVHPLMRDTLMQRASDSGRRVHHHRAAGRALVAQDRPTAHDRGITHLAEAGEIDAALEAIETRMEEALPDRRRALWALAETIFERQALRPEAPRRARLQELAGVATSARPPDSEDRAPTAIVAHRAAEPVAEPVSQFVQVEYIEDELDEEDDDISLAPEAESVPAAPVDPRVAEAAASEGSETWHRGRQLLRRGDIEAAAPCLEEAHAAFLRDGAAAEAARAMTDLAGLARARGEMGVAITRARRARDELRALGADPGAAELEVALAHVARGETSQARFALEPLLEHPDRRVAWLASGALLACFGTDRAAWRRTLALHTAPGERPAVELDAAWTLELAGRRAADGGSAERARQAYALAEARYRDLGATAAADRLRELAESLRARPR